MKTFSLLTNNNTEVGQGYILPSRMVALYQENTSRCIYPSIDTFYNLQKLMDRKIAFNNLGEFYLQREDDVTGISGLGIVALGCVFGKIAVMQWCSKYASINWYENVDDILKIHGHEGRTKLMYV